MTILNGEWHRNDVIWGRLPWIDVDLKPVNTLGKACGLRTEAVRSGVNRMWWESA
ncbi:MAG: hypothetical protein VXZ63_07930 [Planctomycetota bacterium]|nr:hypothetical protein [Planctomycetota bacterium]